MSSEVIYVVDWSKFILLYIISNAYMKNEIA
jgi:hypothetical protein